MKKEVLEKTLWGDYYLNIKAKRILRGAQVQSACTTNFFWLSFCVGKRCKVVQCLLRAKSVGVDKLKVTALGDSRPGLTFLNCSHHGGQIYPCASSVTSSHWNAVETPAVPS